MIGCAVIAAEPGLPEDLQVLGDCAYGTGDARAALLASPGNNSAQCSAKKANTLPTGTRRPTNI